MERLNEERIQAQTALLESHSAVSNVVSDESGYLVRTRSNGSDLVRPPYELILQGESTWSGIRLLSSLKSEGALSLWKGSIIT
jgi:hypothetical protein